LTLFTGVKIPPGPHPTPLPPPLSRSPSGRRPFGPRPSAAGEGRERNWGFAAGGFAARRKTPLQSPLSPGRRPRGEGGQRGVKGQEDLEIRKCQPILNHPGASNRIWRASLRLRTPSITITPSNCFLPGFSTIVEGTPLLYQSSAQKGDSEPIIITFLPSSTLGLISSLPATISGCFWARISIISAATVSIM